MIYTVLVPVVYNTAQAVWYSDTTGGDLAPVALADSGVVYMDMFGKKTLVSFTERVAASRLAAITQAQRPRAYTLATPRTPTHSPSQRSHSQSAPTAPLPAGLRQRRTGGPGVGVGLGAEHGAVQLLPPSSPALHQSDSSFNADEQQLMHAVATPRAIAGVHLSDKTGTLTRNKMVLLGSVRLATGGVAGVKNTVVPNSDSSAATEALVRLHVAATSNTPRAPNLEPEEQAYSQGLGVQLLAVDTDPRTGWQTLRYAWRGREASVRRLLLGFVRSHKSVFTLMYVGGASGASATTGGEVPRYKLVVQGSPEAAQGMTGLRMAPVQLPSLQEALLMAKAAHAEETAAHPTPFPDGAQRNWVYSESEILVAHGDTGELVPEAPTQPVTVRGNMTVPDWQRLVVGQRDGLIAGARAGSLEASAWANLQRKASLWLSSVPVTPTRYMLLMDLWRTDVTRVPAFLSTQVSMPWAVHCVFGAAAWRSTRRRKLTRQLFVLWVPFTGLVVLDGHR